MKINGIMIDCSRLLERHEYYFRLIDFMADWGMNTLLWHFTDDWGCSVALPGFENLAVKNAFSAAQMRRLIAYAKRNKIDIVPELETFGHTRYITDRPEYAHLFAGKKTKHVHFSAVDPLNPQTHALMRRLIASVAQLFESKYLHIGGDEVDMREYCTKHGLNEAQTWAGYVNAVIAMVHEVKRTPLFWADHPTKDKTIARLLSKDVIAVDWRYHRTVKDDVHEKLSRAGFKRIIVAPSIACWEYRFLPNEIALENTAKMARFGFSHKGAGLITTVWCPWRYFQNAIYIGIAFSAYAFRKKGIIDRNEFNRLFARKVFGAECAGHLAQALRLYPTLIITHLIGRTLMYGDKLASEELKRMRIVYANARTTLCCMMRFRPKRNPHIYDGMVLAVKAALLTSGAFVLQQNTRRTEREEYNALLRETKKEMCADWYRGRFADDPQKSRPPFPGQAHGYALLMVDKLKAI